MFEPVPRDLQGEQGRHDHLARDPPQEPPGGHADRRQFRAGHGHPARSRPGRSPGAQQLDDRRSLHARADERHEELYPALPARRGHAGRRGGRGDRLERSGLQGGRPGAELFRLARGVQRPGRGGAEAGDLWPAAPGFSWHRGDAGPHRLCRSSAGRGVEGGRCGVRLRRRRRGRPSRLPDRQAQGPHGDRLGRRRGKGRLSQGTGGGPRHRLQGREGFDRCVDGRGARTASTSISRTSAAPIWRRRWPPRGRWAASLCAG